MVMRIDNYAPILTGLDPDVVIYKVQVLQGGVYVDAALDCCGFVKYDPAQVNNPSLLKITFKARHPFNFADFSFGIQKGTCGPVGPGRPASWPGR